MTRLFSYAYPALALALALSPVFPAQSFAQTADPAARPGDREMTCADVARERAQIMTAVNGAVAPARGGGAFGRGLMGFARNMASVAAPAVIGSMGGGSYVGTIAAQAAGQAASQSISDLGDMSAPVATPVVPQATAEQQARLDRLARIDAFRQCAA